MFFKQLVSYLSGDSLKARFLRGSVWLAAGNIIEKILAFAGKIILARLLMPEELGVIVLIASIAGLFECLTEVGVKQCIIQNKQGDTAEFLNTAWWFQAVRGCSLFIIAWFVSPWVCEFYFEGKEQVLSRYDWPTLFLMVRVAFLSVLFNGFISPRAYLQEKKFNFAKVVAYMQSAALTGTILTIVLSFVLRNAWAMVLGFVCQAFLRMVMSYVFCPFWPHLNIHKESLHSILKFARGMWGSPFLAYIAYQIDILVGGKIVGPELIGMYGFVLALAYIPRELFARIIAPLLVPTFAENQNDHQKLKRIIRRLTELLACISIPVIIACFLFHRTFVTRIYGESFEQVSLVFAFMTINVTLMIISIIFTGLIIALNRPEINRNCTFFRAGILACLIIPVARHYGLMGITLLSTLSNLCMVVLLHIQARKIINYT